MFKLKSGFTKASVMEKIETLNDGSRAQDDATHDCVYENEPDANHCFIGCFIPENHPGLRVRGGVAELLGLYPDLKEHMPFDSIDALVEFQMTHDLAGRGDTHEAAKKFLTEKVEE